MGTNPNYPSNEPVTGGLVYRPTSHDSPLVAEKKRSVPAIIRRAAYFLCVEGLSAKETALRIGRKPETIRAWAGANAFKSTFDEARERSVEAAQRFTLSNKARRLKKLEEHAERIESTIQQRAADPKLASFPGGDQGLTTFEYKLLGSGENAQVVEHYKFDSALSKEFRESLEQFAKEAGDAYSRAAGPTINVQTSVIATSDTKSVLQVLTRNEDSVDV